jgi:hypothetical protein
VAEEQDDLGFSFCRLKTGELEVMHCGRRAATLRGRDAEDFVAEIQGLGSAEEQQLMARITGNYKHGNERLAGQHPRNRR